VGFTHWLRENSEHYLMVDAQRQMAAKYGRPLPPPSRSLRDRFWLSVFAPTYRRLPWKVRRFTIQMMPGSHRQTWTPSARRGTAAVSPDGRTAKSQSQTTPTNRGE
jgi:hypothetical protein